MTELDFQFLARPEPSVFISGFSGQASLLGDLGVFHEKAGVCQVHSTFPDFDRPLRGPTRGTA